MYVCIYIYMVGKQETKQVSCPKLVATRVQLGSWEILILVKDPQLWMENGDFMVENDHRNGGFTH